MISPDSASCTATTASPIGRRLLPAGWVDHGRTFVAHDDTGVGRFGFDYGRHWWMWPEFPGSIAAHGYEGQYVSSCPTGS